MTALKHDIGKPRVDLVPTQAIFMAAKGFEFGAGKYSEYNWAENEGISPDRLYAAALRHLYAHKLGERLDPESAIPHLSHAICAVMMLAVTEIGDISLERPLDADKK
jgi:hypothetical protein